MRLTIAIVAVALACAPAVVAPGVAHVDPVLNGDFEIYAETDGGRGYADGAIWWAEGYGSNAVFADCGCDGDPDREAIVAPGGASPHNFWQSTLPPLQAASLNFDAYVFRVESGAPPSRAEIQVGFSLSPAESQHPWVGIFWEGALVFPASRMSPTAGGWVALDPTVDGSIRCPDWEPCFAFRDAFAAAPDAAAKRDLLGRARIIQNSFWYWNTGVAPVVLDKVAIVAATTAVEELARGNVAAS